MTAITQGPGMSPEVVAALHACKFADRVASLRPAHPDAPSGVLAIDRDEILQRLKKSAPDWVLVKGEKGFNGHHHRHGVFDFYLVVTPEPHYVATAYFLRNLETGQFLTPGSATAIRRALGLESVPNPRFRSLEEFDEIVGEVSLIWSDFRHEYLKLVEVS